MLHRASASCRSRQNAARCGFGRRWRHVDTQVARKDIDPRPGGRLFDGRGLRHGDGCCGGCWSGAAIGAGTGYGAGKGALIGTGVGAAAAPSMTSHANGPDGKEVPMKHPRTWRRLLAAFAASSVVVLAGTALAQDKPAGCIQAGAPTKVEGQVVQVDPNQAR